MIKIPGNKWNVVNSGEIEGILNKTQGIHFDDSGYITVNDKTISLYSSSDNSLFGLPLKMFPFNSKHFILTDKDCWEVTNDLTFTNITDAEANAPDPNAGSDAVVWQDRIYVTSDSTTDVRYWNGTAWTNPSIALSSDIVPHPMAVMGNFSNGYLAVGENNTVKLYDTSHALQTTLTINDNYKITCLLYRQSNLYIGTAALDGGKAKLFVWNGSGTSALYEYDCGSDWIFSMTEYDSSFVIVTNEGEVLRWNGGGFNQLAVFPVFNSPYRWSNVVGGVSGRVAMNGMISDGDLLYINIDGSVGSPYTINNVSESDSYFLAEQPSGVWCFDPKVGLYCRSLHSRDGYTTFTASDLSNNVLTLSANTNIKTGDPFLVFENGSLTGVNDDTVYYAIKVDTNQIKIAMTPAEAHAGTAITLGGSITNATFLIADYSQVGDLFQFGKRAGGIGLLHSTSYSPPIFPDLFRTYYLWGFKDGDSVTRLCSGSKITNTGFFSTVKIFASGIQDSWNKVYTIFRDFYGSSAKIIVRYKIKEKQNLPTPIIYGTYSNTRTIGSSDTAIDLAQSGDSVHILYGNGAGEVRTIKSITDNEIIVTEDITGVTSGDAIGFYLDTWREAQIATSETNTVDNGYIQSSLGEGHSTWVELLIEIRGTIKIPDIRVVNKPYKQTN